MKKIQESAFWHYMESHWPQWPEIWEGLQKEPLKVLWLNPHVTTVDHSIETTHQPYWDPLLPHFRLFYRQPGKVYEPTINPAGLLDYYIIDPLSLHIAQALPIPTPHSQVLDACSAPGGKTLVLHYRVSQQQGQLISNEPNPQRRKDLFWVVQHWIPKPLRMNLRITGYPAQKWGHPSYRMPLQAALVDAPCSHDRQLARSPERWSRWHEGYPKKLAQTQYEILCAVAHNIQPGGYLLYSVCTLSDWETRGVVHRFMDKFGSCWKIQPLVEINQLPEASPTAWGTYLLPYPRPMGPFFACLFEREN